MMKNFKRHLLASFWLLIELTMVKSQFTGTQIDSSLTAIDVRKGTVVEYSLLEDANPGDEFRWEVVGGKIITPVEIGEGIAADPSLLEFTANMHTILVKWQVDDSTANFFDGSIKVQKKTAGQCASEIIKQKIKQWSLPTASIDRNFPDFSICSGEDVGGYIVVDLTGAANFAFTYRIHSNGLSDESGSAINTEFREISSPNDTVHIMLPARLINPSVAASKYFKIELTAMHDDFLGNGVPVSDRKEFTITVYPAIHINTIESIRLNRR
jgi:hypothetical protein